jgi:alpha-glucosidase
MHWWQSAVIYQIYLRSFQDTNGDGVGDLAGITARLPYLAELGVDAIWLSPIYVSPMKDFGYDISDHAAIDPRFGTMDDFDTLLRQAHALGLKVILDFVPNHTSDKHRWFADSQSSRVSEKRDWYIWRDPSPQGGPPNNWLSEFGGSAWAYDAASGQYYYHAFLREQPDLNWRNPAVRAAMHDVMRFWLKRGVDGFRVDVLWHLIKDGQFRDEPANEEWRVGEPDYRRLRHIYSCDRPEVHDVVEGLRQVADEFPERVLIGEIYLPLERVVAYYGRDLAGAHMPFNFSLIETPWKAADIAALIERYEGLLPAGAWPNWVLGNHDRPRLAARIGERQARIAAMLLLTLRGTPTLYYGDELGMPQVAVAPGELRDPWGVNVPGFGRDGCRTPMQWDGSPHAGFSTTVPWLPQSADAAARNVEAQRAEPASMLNLYRRLMTVRRAHPALVSGGYRRITAEKGVLTFLRQQDDERFLVALNLTDEPHSAILPGAESGIVVISAMAEREGQAVAGHIDLAAHEGVVVRLT